MVSGVLFFFHAIKCQHYSRVLTLSHLMDKFKVGGYFKETESAAQVYIWLNPPYFPPFSNPNIPLKIITFLAWQTQRHCHKKKQGKTTTRRREKKRKNKLSFKFIKMLTSHFTSADFKTL